MDVQYRFSLRTSAALIAFAMTSLWIAFLGSTVSAQTFDPLGRGLFNRNQGILAPQGGLINSLGIGPTQFGSYQGPQIQPRVQQPTLNRGLFQTPNLQTNDNFPLGTRLPQTAPIQPGAINNSAAFQQGPAFTQPQLPPPCNNPGLACNRNKKRHLIPKIEGTKTPAQRGKLFMTPSRIIAPVGSEVVVLSGICGGDGFFVTNQPLEWNLSNDSVGQIIEVGGTRHHPNFNKLIPPTAKKFNGQYAWGRTGLKSVVLTRGTPTHCDDIQLAKGQTFISVSSASPGTTYITGVAPGAEGWDRRRAVTRIHWVDGMWAVPAPIRATSGTVSPLTTVISQADGNGGIDGWKVRYSIVGGAPAEFAPSGSQTAEATSDESGEATVQIRQRAGLFDPGTTQVRVDIVRPAVLGERELVVESGITSVTWSAPALTIRAVGDAVAGVGDPFNYRVEVLNTGDQLARGVVVRTKDFDPDIEYISAVPKPTQFGNQFEWALGDLAPGGSPQVINVQLRTQKRGTAGLCFEVASESDRLRADACSQTEVSAPCIGLEISGPDTARVGEDIRYNIGIVNQCDEPLRNIELLLTPDAALVAEGRSTRVIKAEIPELGFGERRDMEVGFVATDVGRHCFRVDITTDDGEGAEALECVIVNQQGRPGIDLQIDGGEPFPAGGRTRVNAIVTNTGNSPLNAVSLINEYPRSIEPVRVSQNAEVVLGENETISSPLIMKLGRLEPGDEQVVTIEYEGLSVDPNAQLSFAVTSSESAGNTQGLPIRIEPAADGDTRGRDPAGPVFGPGPQIPGSQGPADGGTGIQGPEGPITIPQDPAAGTLQTGGLNVQMRSSLQSVSISNQEQAVIQFRVTNNDTVPHENVDISVLMPQGLIYKGANLADSRLGVANQVTEQSPRIDFTRRQTLRPGESIDLFIAVQGTQAGQNQVEVLAESLQTRPVSSVLPIGVRQ